MYSFYCNFLRKSTTTIMDIFLDKLFPIHPNSGDKWNILSQITIIGHPRRFEFLNKTSLECCQWPAEEGKTGFSSISSFPVKAFLWWKTIISLEFSVPASHSKQSAVYISILFSHSNISCSIHRLFSQGSWQIHDGRLSITYDLSSYTPKIIHPFRAEPSIHKAI